VGGRQVAIHQIGNSVPSQLGRIMGLAISDQVFGVKLPFKIRYMDSGHELGFRNRKRNMTKLYEDRARAAISRLVTKKGPKRTDTPATLVRFQDSRFRWSAKEIKDSIRFEIHRSVEDGVLSLRIGPAAKQARFTVEITPTSGSADWGIPYPKIVLSSVAGKRGDIYPLWRTLEEVIQQESGIADLVQFSGYYQYAPSIRVKLDYKKVSDADVGFWRFWERVAQAGRSLELHIDEFGALTGIARNSLEEVFSQFREVGFEVRNSNTNPQMARGNYLVPYIFPTLKPDSVQLNKKL
jgi:DNA (cytosine-5)-methyltransferase 1